MRIRAAGGELTAGQLDALAEVSARYGDGDLHLTRRANVQLRGLPLLDGALVPEVEAALLALIPSAAHELVRNIMVSPLTGLAGGRADLRPLARSLDAGLCAEPALAGLPGRFLFVLDDGRGDLLDRPLDLGAVAVSAGEVQVRAGSGWGPVVAIERAPGLLLELAHAFLAARGTGPSAAWHVDELAAPLLGDPPDPRTAVSSGPAPYGPGPGYEHVPVPGGVLTPAQLSEVRAGASDGLVITPWHGLLLLDR